MEPGAQPPGAEQDEEDEPEPQAPTQAIEGHGQVLLMGNFWPQEERFLTLQDILEQSPTSRPTQEPSSTRATCGHSSSSDCSWRRRLKRPSDGSSDDTEGRAAKCKRSAQKPPQSSAGTPRSRAVAEDAASGCQDPRLPLPLPLPPPPPREPGARLLLVFCRASALRSQLPRLQLLLRRVHARHRSPPAALVGIVVLPRREEEAEARRRMESLLGSAFGPQSPAVEVHTAVFSPSRPEGTLDIQRAAAAAAADADGARGGTHEAPARGCVTLMDQETQTEGEEPEGEGWERQAAAAGTPGDSGETSLQRETLCGWLRWLGHRPLQQARREACAWTLLVPVLETGPSRDGPSPGASTYTVWVKMN